MITAAQATPGFPAEVVYRLYEVNALLQAERARLSTKSTHQMVPETGHFIHIDRPDVLIATVADLLERVHCCE